MIVFNDYNDRTTVIITLNVYISNVSYIYVVFYSLSF